MQASTAAAPAMLPTTAARMVDWVCTMKMHSAAIADRNTADFEARTNSAIETPTTTPATSVVEAPLAVSSGIGGSPAGKAPASSRAMAL